MAITNFAEYSQQLGQNARRAALTLARASVAQKNAALREMAALIRKNAATIKSANAIDVSAAREAGLSAVMLNRLELTDKHIETMAMGLEQVAAQTDPVGQVLEGSVRPNGLEITKIRVPIGVVAIIFEARPNVTADAAGLCLRSGNACILRGGKEAIHANLAIAKLLREAIATSGLPADAVQVVETTDRALVPELLKLDTLIDLVIPRGGESLIRAVVEQSRIPVIKHYTGNCHVYVDKDCESVEFATKIVVNAKCQRPSVCNATETLLIHRAIAKRDLPMILKALTDNGVKIHGCAETCAICPSAIAATEDDWHREYLDLEIAVRVVDDVEQAVEHINRYGSHHTDAILSTHAYTIDAFVKGVDTASVMINTTTRFSDGFEYGLGAEIGISTDKLHARGPMGAADLTTYKYVVRGCGQVRG